MGKSIKNQIPWTKSLYNSFLDDAILTELEKKVLYARVWERDICTITKMTIDFHVGKTTINNAIASIRRKYDFLHYTFPDKYPRRVTSNVEKGQIVDKMKQNGCKN